MKKGILAGLMSFMLVFSLAACSSAGTSSDSSTSTTSEKKTVVVGGTSISQVFYEALKDVYEAKGYTTEFKTFDSNQVVLEAAASDEVDIAIGQHKRYVQSFDKNNGADLDMVKPYAFYTGIGLYSEKYTSVDEFPDGSQIAIMNDAMNEDIALRILENCGLIKLDDGVEQATVADIKENPKNLEIIEMDQAQTVTSLEDMAGACVFFTHMSAAGKDPSSYLERDNVMINYPMGVIVREANLEADWAVDFAKCFREDKDVQSAIDAKYPNVFEFYTSDSQVSD